MEGETRQGQALLKAGEVKSVVGNGRRDANIVRDLPKVSKSSALSKIRRLLLCVSYASLNEHVAAIGHAFELKDRAKKTRDQRRYIRSLGARHHERREPSVTTRLISRMSDTRSLSLKSLFLVPEETINP